MAWMQKICEGLTSSQAEEIYDFIRYAQEIGLLSKTDTKEDVAALCRKYWREKSKITRESVTGGLRSPKSYTNNLQEVIDLVTIQDGVLPVGSFRFNVHKFPSDVDLYEQIHACCSVEEAKQKVAEGIQHIGRKIRAAPDVFLGDFKAGKDSRFEIDIGKWVTLGDVSDVDEIQVGQSLVERLATLLGFAGDVEGGEMLEGFDPAAIEKQVKRLRQERLISFDELKRITSLLNQMGATPTRDQWKELEQLLRDHQVLRWNPQEIAQGYKMLPGFKKLTLGDAIGQGTLVKLDAWAKVDGRWIEATNFFMVDAVDLLGNRIELLTQELPDYEKSMSKDVRHYSSAENRKTLKALKRLWALSLFKNDLALAHRITPLFSSNAAALNQVVGDAEVLGLMLARLDDPPVEDIMAQIDAFKPKIDQVNDVVEMNPVLFELIDSIVKPFYARPVAEYTQFDDAIQGLEKLQELAGSAVEKMIYSRATEAGLENPADFVAK
uniref:Nucleotidyltransferase n=1 Tax=viral metagenome TaxID=1070528 RepID=A0A6C0BN84_9ZZZZ